MNAIQTANKNKKPELQFAIGFAYEYGNGVQVNYSEADRWYNLAAAQGYTSAMTRLGVMSYEGLGTDKSPSTAFYWFEKAAQLGHKDAQNLLGVMYEGGLGTEINNAMAVKWFQKAAYQGAPSAQYSLGNQYFTGRGVNQNYSLAQFWFEKVITSKENGSSSGKDKANYRMGQIFEQGLGTPIDGTKARHYYMEAAHLGHDDAKLKIGDAYKEGKWGITQDTDKALYWYRKADTLRGQLFVQSLEATLKHQKWCRHVSSLPNEQWSVNDARYFERTCLNDKH